MQTWLECVHPKREMGSGPLLNSILDTHAGRGWEQEEMKILEKRKHLGKACEDLSANPWCSCASRGSSDCLYQSQNVLHSSRSPWAVGSSLFMPRLLPSLHWQLHSSCGGRGTGFSHLPLWLWSHWGQGMLSSATGQGEAGVTPQRITVGFVPSPNC